MNVTFCGHNKVYNKAELTQWLDTIIPKLIEQGADSFYFTGEGEFDPIAAQTVKKLKPKHSRIYSTVESPYPPSSVGFDEPRETLFDRELYDFCTRSSMYKNLPLHRAVAMRNEWMASICDVVVAYVVHNQDDTARTLDIAIRNGKIIVQFPDTEVNINR